MSFRDERLLPQIILLRVEDLTEAVEDAELGLAGDHGIDAGRVDVGVAQDVGETDDVFFPLVVGNGKEVAEVVEEDPGGRDIRVSGEVLHSPGDGGAVEGAAARVTWVSDGVSIHLIKVLISLVYLSMVAGLFSFSIRCVRNCSKTEAVMFRLSKAVSSLPFCFMI